MISQFWILALKTEQTKRLPEYSSKELLPAQEEASLGSLTSSTIKFLEVWNQVRKPTGN